MSDCFILQFRIWLRYRKRIILIEWHSLFQQKYCVHFHVSFWAFVVTMFCLNKTNNKIKRKTNEFLIWNSLFLPYYWIKKKVLKMICRLENEHIFYIGDIFSFSPITVCDILGNDPVYLYMCVCHMWMLERWAHQTIRNK